MQSDKPKIKKDKNIDRSKSSKEKEGCVLYKGSHDIDECKAYNDMVVKLLSISYVMDVMKKYHLHILPEIVQNEENAKYV